MSDVFRGSSAFLLDFAAKLHHVAVTDASGKDMHQEDGIERGVGFIMEVHKSGGSLVFVGNGGSAAIASHQSTDFIRTCKMRAYAPNDLTLLTCMGNDCGYENVFAEPLKVLLRPEDLLIAISSSGKSENILRAVTVAREKGCRVITLSGFGDDNPLRASGDINFYVSSHSYRIVESAHLFICNWLLEFTILALEERKTP